MSIKISKISYFSLTFKLNEKKKVPLRNEYGRKREGYKKMFAGGGIEYLIWGWKYLKKKGGGLEKKGVKRK